MPKGKPSPDLSGQTIGLWTVVERDYTITTYTGVCYVCVCACGLRKTVRATSLMTGRSSGCRACHARRVALGRHRLKDLTGEQFGDWMVLAFSHISNDRAYWICVCACGLTKAVNGVSLRSGTSSSCASCARRRVIKTAAETECST